jgi:hypothetical protein
VVAHIQGLPGRGVEVRGSGAAVCG